MSEEPRPAGKRNTPAGNDVDAAMRKVRKLGYALLLSALTIDVVVRERDRFKRAMALRYSKWVDEALPEENFLLDFALSLLQASDRK